MCYHPTAPPRRTLCAMPAYTNVQYAAPSRVYQEVIAQVYGGSVPAYSELGMWESTLYSWLNVLKSPVYTDFVNTGDPGLITEGEEVGYKDFEPVIPVGETPNWTWSNPWFPGIWTGAQLPNVGDQPVFETGSIYGPEGAVGPIDPSIYDIPYEDTEPGEAEVADPLEDEDMPFHGDSWVDFAWGVAADYFGVGLTPDAFVGPTTTTPPAAPPPAMPGAPMNYNCPPQKTRTLTIDCATGKEVKRTRRRRRRILTNSDYNDLMRIATLPNKQNVAVALAKAIGR